MGGRDCVRRPYSVWEAMPILGGRSRVCQAPGTLPASKQHHVLPTPLPSTARCPHSSPSPAALSLPCGEPQAWGARRGAAALCPRRGCGRGAPSCPGGAHTGAPRAGPGRSLPARGGGAGAGRRRRPAPNPERCPRPGRAARGSRPHWQRRAPSSSSLPFPPPGGASALLFPKGGGGGESLKKN